MLFWILLIALILFFFFSGKVSDSKVLKHRSQVVCFYSNDCGYCKQLIHSGKWDKVANYFRQYDNISVKKVEERDNPELFRKYQISGVPTIMILKDDETVVPYEGEREPESIINFVKKTIH